MIAGDLAQAQRQVGLVCGQGAPLYGCRARFCNYLSFRIGWVPAGDGVCLHFRANDATVAPRRQSREALWWLVVVGLWLLFSPLAGALGMTALPLAYFGWLALILLPYVLLVQGVKMVYIRRYQH